MNERRTRVLCFALLTVLMVWGLALLGYRMVVNSRMTVEQVNAFLDDTDLARLSAGDRAAALRGLAERINALSFEERRRVRQEARWKAWLEQMTETEKEEMIAATFPTGIKQMMTAFEQMSEPQRRRVVDDALKRLRSTGELAIGDDSFVGRPGQSPQRQPPISPQVEEKIREVGLRTFFAESSAQMKVEAAPLLEEIQHQMQSGGWGRYGKR